MEKAKVRDKRFDLIKGIAISLVVIKEPWRKS